MQAGTATIVGALGTLGADYGNILRVGSWAVSLELSIFIGGFSVPVSNIQFSLWKFGPGIMLRNMSALAPRKRVPFQQGLKGLIQL